MHMHVFSCFIPNCQNLEATKMSFSRWMNKLWSIQTMEYESVLKRNELSSHEKTWRNIKCILLSERSQSAKATHCIISTMWHSGRDKTMETVKRSVLAGGGQQGQVEPRGNPSAWHCSADTCHHMQRMYITRSESWWNYDAGSCCWVRVCSSVVLNVPVVWDVDGGSSVYVEGRGGGGVDRWFVETLGTFCSVLFWT